MPPIVETGFPPPLPGVVALAPPPFDNVGLADAGVCPAGVTVGVVAVAFGADVAGAAVVAESNPVIKRQNQKEHAQTFIGNALISISFCVLIR